MSGLRRAGAFVVRLLRPVGRSLITMGALYVGADALIGMAITADLPPGHPERLRPDLPLTLLELELEQELEQVMGWRARVWSRDAD